MEISIFEQFKIFDAGKQKNINSIIQQLGNLSANNISINFVNCLIDYPATSQLVDKILIDLSNNQNLKTLIIKS